MSDCLGCEDKSSLVYDHICNLYEQGIGLDMKEHVTVETKRVDPDKRSMFIAFEDHGNNSVRVGRTSVIAIETSAIDTDFSVLTLFSGNQVTVRGMPGVIAKIIEEHNA